MIVFKFLLLLISLWGGPVCDVSGAAFDGQQQNCQSCSREKAELPKEELKQLRFDYLKHQILKKLHLSAPPKMDLPKPSLKTLLQIAEMADNETADEIEYSAPKESVLIYPIDGDHSCEENEIYPCSRFEFVMTENFFLESFVSAEVWLFNSNTANPLIVHQTITDSLGNFEKMELSVEDEGIKKPWNKFLLPSHSYWFNYARDRVLTLQVIQLTNGTSVEKAVGETGDVKPFIIIRGFSNGGHSRTHRSISCVEGSTFCCKENFVLKFSEIGWDNWILHPEEYQANFCRGRCANDLSNTRFYHSTVLLNYIRDNKDLADEIGLTMCCTPSTMSHLSIFYRNEEGLIYYKRLEDMKVEACDCA